MKAFSIATATTAWLASLALSFNTFTNANIIITEIMNNPERVSDDFGEWFEVYNGANVTVNMRNWTVTGTLNNESFVINATLNVAPRSYAVLGASANTTLNGNVTVNFQYRGTLQGFRLIDAGNDRIILRNGAGVEQDRVEYQGTNAVNATWPNAPGASMSLRDVNLDNNNGTNWCKSIGRPSNVSDPATPGFANVCADSVAATSAPIVPSNDTLAPVAAPVASPPTAPTPPATSCDAFENQCSGWIRDGTRIHLKVGGFCISKCHKSFLLNVILRLGWRCGECR